MTSSLQPTLTTAVAARARLEKAWRETPDGLPRGYIQARTLTELWFNTGTICNLSCPFCLEGSGPGDDRLEVVTLEDTKPLMDEAARLGIGQFSFTGGEPFVVRDMVSILDFALEWASCLVLTNGTKPLRQRLDSLAPLREKPHALSFRISLDYPDPERHDRGRGEGSFRLALESIGDLHRLGFGVSVARRQHDGEDSAEVDARFRPYLDEVGATTDVRIVSFPDFLLPGSNPAVPHVTEDCMTRYHTAESRAAFMCASSRMAVKQDGRMRVYACTLVDDDADYDLGATLSESIGPTVMLKHHRCYSCFAYGASCSEL